MILKRKYDVINYKDYLFYIYVSWSMMYYVLWLCYYSLM